MDEGKKTMDSEIERSRGQTPEMVDRDEFVAMKVRNYSFQPGDFGYGQIGEFEAVGLLSSPFPHSEGYTFYVVYANARHERLLIRYEVDRLKVVTEAEHYRYQYSGAEAY